MDWIYLAQDKRLVTCSCERGNEPSGSIKCWVFLEWLSNCWILRKDSAPWSQLVTRDVINKCGEETHSASGK
jgi:hypothetical protein